MTSQYMEGNRVHNSYMLCSISIMLCWFFYVPIHSKVHRSMLLVSLRYVQYSMCRVTNFKVHYATLLLLWGKVRYAMLARLWCYILKCNVASFITLCSIFYVPSDKFQSALCNVASTNVAKCIMLCWSIFGATF